MPELPEVETVRRGLQPVMEGARFVRVEMRRPICAFRFRRTSTSGSKGDRHRHRPARQVHAGGLSSGEVLLMHLGMSGSFRVVHGSDESGPGKFHHVRGKLSAHDHVVFHMSNGAIVTFNDPRRFGYMKLIARDALNQDPMIEALGPSRSATRSTVRCWRRPCAGKKTA
jgi:formamidopyrimidine-DNA glycosylase